MNDFDRFYRRYVRLIYAMALARGVDPGTAEDLTQEAFLRAWRHFPRLADLETAAQRAWLIQVVRNLACTVWRRRITTVADSGDLCAPEAGPGQAALRLDIARALSRLDETDREIVVLRYFSEMNSREIGETLQIPEGTVRRRLAGCRTVLAARLAAWAPEEER